MKPALIKWLSGLGSLATFTIYLANTQPVNETNAQINDQFDEPIPGYDENYQNLADSSGAHLKREQYEQIERNEAFDFSQSADVKRTEDFHFSVKEQPEMLAAEPSTAPVASSLPSKQRVQRKPLKKNPSHTAAPQKKQPQQNTTQQASSQESPQEVQIQPDPVVEPQPEQVYVEPTPEPQQIDQPIDNWINQQPVPRKRIRSRAS